MDSLRTNSVLILMTLTVNLMYKFNVSNSADAVRVYGVKGQSITLQPELPNVSVEFVQWILNGDVIAHWDQEGSESSDPSLLLDKDIFSLTISFLQENNTGLYIFIVNNIETNISYQLRLKGRWKKYTLDYFAF